LTARPGRRLVASMSALAATPRPSTLAAAHALWWREVVRFYRQRSRIIGALSSPVLFWAVLGGGLGSSFSVSTVGGQTVSYAPYFFPGILTLTVLFTSILSMISIIEDRQAGFLQGVLVSPVSRMAIVLGKVAGGATLGLLQVAMMCVLLPLAGLTPTVPGLLMALIVTAMMSVALAALGYLIAWSMESTQGFHVLLNTLLMPMWMLSTSAFPLEGATPWIAWMMRLNPLTYTVDALRYVLFASAGREMATQTGLSLAALLGISAGFSVVMVGLAAAVTRKR